MSAYGFVRTSNGYYQPIVDDVPWGDPVPTAAEAVKILAEFQENNK